MEARTIPPPNVRPLRRGMTLIEVMIAISILMIGLTVVFSSLLTARKVSEQATNMALAYQEIQAQVETYQYLPFNDLQRHFKGTSFAVKGLLAPLVPGSSSVRRTSVGTITRLQNPTPYATSLWPTNVNAFDNSQTRLPLRFRVEWDQDGSTMSAEVVYVLTYRGI